MSTRELYAKSMAGEGFEPSKVWGFTVLHSATAGQLNEG